MRKLLTLVRRLLNEIAVYIKPSTVFVNEAADLMQAVCLPIQPGSGNKFYRGVLSVLLGMVSQLKAQPLQAWWIRFQLGRARVRVPGFQ